MQIKEGVSLVGLQLSMRPVMTIAEDIWEKYGQELVITSGTEGKHMAGSYHYFGHALDLRIRYFDDVIQRSVALELEKRLQETAHPLYVVVLHTRHIHVQYNA